MISIAKMPSDRGDASGDIGAPGFSFVSLTVNQAWENTPANMRAEFRNVDAHVEAPWLCSLLKQLPAVLPVLDDPERSARLEQLALATCPADWRIGQQIEVVTNGLAVVERFLREVPLLTEDEVRQQSPNLTKDEWDHLLQVTYENQTLFFAEQFAPDGSVIPICRQIMMLLDQYPDRSAWDTALWWINPTGWLISASPREMYQEDPEAVLTAAQQCFMRE